MFKDHHIKPGMVIGDITVKELDHVEKKDRGRYISYWKCDCACGNKDVIMTNRALKKGMNGHCIPNCGCRTAELQAGPKNSSDLTNRRFDRLVAIEPVKYETKSGRTELRWKCKCDCGNIAYVRKSDLLNGYIKSCGCYKADVMRDNHYIPAAPENAINETAQRKRLYGILHDMRQRCYNPNNVSYKRYGARGITVCDEWLGPLKEATLRFEKWALANGYADNLTIDRIDSDGPYAPWNCRWSDDLVQANNKVLNRLYYDGEEILTQEQFVKKYDLYTYKFIEYRMLHGWSWDAILYASQHPEEGINYKKERGMKVYRDKDGFMVLIPKLQIPEDIKKKLDEHEAARLENKKTHKKNYRYD